MCVFQALVCLSHNFLPKRQWNRATQSQGKTMPLKCSVFCTCFSFSWRMGNFFSDTMRLGPYFKYIQCSAWKATYKWVNNGHLQSHLAVLSPNGKSVLQLTPERIGPFQQWIGEIILRSTQKEASIVCTYYIITSTEFSTVSTELID